MCPESMGAYEVCTARSSPSRAGPDAGHTHRYIRVSLGKISLTSWFISPVMFSTLAAIAALACGAFASSQAPFHFDATAAAAGSAANPLPVGTYSSPGNLTLSSIASRDEYTAFAHPRYPAHRVRIKQTDFCDPTVK